MERTGTSTRGGWFDGVGFGMFVHWDPASQGGLEVSWPMVGGVFSLPRCQAVAPEEYWSYADTFDPREWDPQDLARRARAAGMRYVVFTTRHHAGYAMWDTAYGDHKITASPYGRDLLAELVVALRAEGLRVGFYYSLSDWHHADYPPFTAEQLPYRFDRMTVPTDEQAERYRAYLMGQLRELLTGYGPIDLLWFDGQWERPGPWWRPADIAELARSLHPDILINDRLPGHGDFATPEQFVPPRPLEGRWESCQTINGSWGWNTDDPDHKSPLQLVTTLCETVGRGGNLLLNISPRGDGTLPPEQVERLDAIATWMGPHHTAIHDVDPGLEPWQFYGPSTRSGATVHLFLVLRPTEGVTVR
ncbi:MAG: alpha-L-fucosidase, partial [Planctomycetes bacterium]|nr:alpha-L-fucosidase [Planctomycetota bacterium]